jgi:hypothetical protein
MSEEKEKDTTTVLVEVDSITYAEQRVLLADKLNLLIDSIDQTIERVQRDSNSLANLKYNDVMDDLRYTKDRVERDLQEVNTTAIKGWDEDNVTRIELNMDKNRRELDKVLSDIGK